MGVFRRPELIKDNPVAPQMYVGPRRRLALARAASTSQVPTQGDMVEALQTVRETVVARAPKLAHQSERGWRDRIRRALRLWRQAGTSATR